MIRKSLSSLVRAPGRDIDNTHGPHFEHATAWVNQDRTPAAVMVRQPGLLRQQRMMFPKGGLRALVDLGVLLRALDEDDPPVLLGRVEAEDPPRGGAVPLTGPVLGGVDAWQTHRVLVLLEGAPVRG